MGLDFYLYDYDESLKEAVMALRKRRPSTYVSLDLFKACISMP